MSDVADPARRVAEDAARRSYGKLLAWLAARSRDIAAAEDALADAFAQALAAWPERGVPDSPEAWLLTAARRNLGKRARHARVAQASAPALALLDDERAQDEAGVVPDRRLELLFVCAHPAIDPAAHTPLMLQTVLGLDAARIASAFLVSPDAMGKRLTRAKAKIRDAGIAFALPAPDDLGPRLEAVRDAIYAAYTCGWDEAPDGDRGGSDLAREALFLGRLLAACAPDDPESLGLCSLMLHAEARRAARRDASGAFVALDDQDTALWDRSMIAAAEAALARAAGFARPGRYQIEAAIQSFHVARRAGGSADWAALDALYAALWEFAPTMGTAVGRAAVALRADNADIALARLDALPAEKSGYQPYWAVRAAALEALGRRDEACSAYARAAGLAGDPAVRARLLRRV
jgi:RNA polymerase sigma-70 factor, ECF subfamily